MIDIIVSTFVCSITLFNFINGNLLFAIIVKSKYWGSSKIAIYPQVAQVAFQTIVL